MQYPGAVLRIFALLCVLLPLTACGQNRGTRPAEELKPEYYVLDPEDQPADGQHLRFAAPGDEAGGLDIAVTDFVHVQTGVRVALFGVVHIADVPYYRVVKRRLAAYDVVLYEGIKPDTQSAAEWQAGFNSGEGEVASLQRKLAKWFGFQYQLDALDYTAANFVHADMTEQAFLEGGGGVLMPDRKRNGAASGAEDGENEPSNPDYGIGDRTLTSGVMQTLHAVEQFGEEVLTRPTLLRSMARRMFAETMGTADIGSALDMFPGLGDLVLTKRNEVVIERLKETLAGPARSIVIFYGAAHMKDLQQRLVDDLGFRREHAEWLRAWAIRPPLSY